VPGGASSSKGGGKDRAVADISAWNGIQLLIQMLIVSLNCVGSGVEGLG
jgi:hypothetical protein